MLALLEVGVEAEILLDFFLDARDVFGLGQLEDRLGVVGDGAVAIDGDVDRSHAEEAERDQAEGEDRCVMSFLRSKDAADPLQADEIGRSHQPGDEHAFPEGAEVARDQAGEDRQRRAAFARGGDDFMHVLGMGAGEDLGEFGNEHRRQRAAADDGGQLPPQISAARVREFDNSPMSS